MRYQKDMGYQSQFPIFPTHSLRSVLTLHHLWDRMSATFFSLPHPSCRHRRLCRAVPLHTGKAGTDSGSPRASSLCCSSSLLPASLSLDMSTVPRQTRPWMSSAMPCNMKITPPPTTSSQKNCSVQFQRQRLLRSFHQTKLLYALMAYPTTLEAARQPVSNLFMSLRA